MSTATATLIASFVTLAGLLGGATASVVGLVISKETKISEFRQSWIDALRNDIAELLGILTLLHHTRKVVGAEEQHRIATAMGTLSARIMLRLNLAETESENVRVALSAVRTSANNVMKLADEPDAEKAKVRRKLRQANALALSASQTLLKKEWERVKKGEKTYSVTLKITRQLFKWLSILMGCILVLTLLWWAYTQVVAPSISAMSR
jgi:hypothetical protein